MTVYLSRARGFARLFRLPFGWELLLRRSIPGERWRTSPPKRETEMPLLAADNETERTTA